MLFKSGMHGLNEEFGRHRGWEGRKECMLCRDECESVSHVLWECPAYSSISANFVMQLQAGLGGSYSHFEARSSFEKASFTFILGNELWEEYLEFLLYLVKEYVVDVWEKRKSRFYGKNAFAQQPSLQSPTRVVGDIAGVKVRDFAREVSLAQVS